MRGELIMATGLTRQPSLLLLLVSSSLHSRPSENTIDIAELALLVVLVLFCFINRTNHCYPVNTIHFITFVQCWTNVEDVGPTLCKCYENVLYLLGFVNKMCVLTSRIENICAYFKQIWVIFNHLKLWVAVARHDFKTVKI